MLIIWSGFNKSNKNDYETKRKIYSQIIFDIIQIQDFSLDTLFFNTHLEYHKSMFRFENC